MKAGVSMSPWGVLRRPQRAAVLPDGSEKERGREGGKKGRREGRKKVKKEGAKDAQKLFGTVISRHFFLPFIFLYFSHLLP